MKEIGPLRVLLPTNLCGGPSPPESGGRTAHGNQLRRSGSRAATRPAVP
jgi:hypothetical protein